MRAEQRTVYVADDGAEFDTLECCLEYETRAKLAKLFEEEAAYGKLSVNDAVEVVMLRLANWEFKQ